jgi:lysophospholipase L1-like esterase
MFDLGHIILMRDYVVKLKPDYVIFLIGINDLAKSEFDQEDGFLINRKEASWRKLIKKSELITTISNVATALKTEKVSLKHGKNPKEYVNDRLNKMDDTQRTEFENNSASNLKLYLERVAELYDLCKSAAITPVFVTQPKYDDNHSYSWKAMQQYNEALLTYCSAQGIYSIDLANKLPKEITYYYDPIHFTNAGSEAIASILYPEISTLINSNKE